MLHKSLLALLSRYSTLIHEVFHSVSVGLNEPDYRAWKGYEEGIVEQCNRLWRAVILANAGLPPSTDARTSYNDRIILLESLRTRTQKAEQDFYLSLLQTPLRDREGAQAAVEAAARSVAAANTVARPGRGCNSMDTNYRSHKDPPADRAKNAPPANRTGTLTREEVRELMFRADTLEQCAEAWKARWQRLH